MVSAAAGPFLIAAILLIVAGVAKVRSPASTVGAFKTMGLPASIGTVRALGAGECLLGVAALAVPNAVVAAGVGVVYLGFAVTIAHALRSSVPLRSCGCFGSKDTPPTRFHLAINVVGAVAGGLAAAVGTSNAWALLIGSPAYGVPLVAAALAACALVYYTVVELPLLFSAYDTAG